MNNSNSDKPSHYLIGKVNMVKYQTDYMRAHIRGFFKDVGNGKPFVGDISFILLAAMRIKEAADELKEQAKRELIEEDEKQS